MDTILFILSLCLKVFTLYFALVAVFALKKRTRRPRTAPGLRFAVALVRDLQTIAPAANASFIRAR